MTPLPLPATGSEPDIRTVVHATRSTTPPAALPIERERPTIHRRT